MSLIPPGTQRLMCRALGAGHLVFVEGRSAPGLFTDRYASSAMNPGMSMSDVAPAVTVSEEDCERLGIRQGIELAVVYGTKSTTYIVRDPQRAASGLVTILLDALA